MRILLTEGSGLTSRQVATRLVALGHRVEVLSSTPLCLTRFTRDVRKVHPVPSFGREPLAWLDAAVKVYTARAIDVLFPTHEQVAILSAIQGTIPVNTVVPDFRSLMRVQDKISAFQTLAEAGVPQPQTFVIADEKDLANVDSFPAFLKRPIGTASSGIRRARSVVELRAAVRELDLADGPLIAQAAARGRLAMIQALADGERLIAFHANARVREGAGGGASIKESISLPGLAAHVERLVQSLGWRGPISFDAILTEAGPVVIDVNPRLVEPMNAYLSGVDLVGPMLELA